MQNVARSLDTTKEQFVAHFNENFSANDSHHPVNFLKRLRAVEFKLQDLQVKMKQVEAASQELAMATSTTGHDTKSIVVDVTKRMPELNILLPPVERTELQLFFYARDVHQRDT